MSTPNSAIPDLDDARTSEDAAKFLGISAKTGMWEVVASVMNMDDKLTTPNAALGAGPGAGS